jgi:sodium pump decarboxylase gamma subunit
MIQGLQVSILGIFVTFLALGVFILIMVVLKRLFPAESEQRSIGAQEAQEEALSPVEVAASDEEGAVIAAIAAALSNLRSKDQSKLGGSLEEGRSEWWSSHRSAARSGKVERR